MFHLTLRLLALIYFISYKVKAQVTCTGRSVVNCIGYDARNDGCYWDFTANSCSSTPHGTCQLQTNSTNCMNSGCFYDPYISRCLDSLSQNRWAFSCSYWASSAFLQADPYGQGIIDPACSYHACVFDSTLQTCSTITNQGVISNINNNSYAQNAVFLNPQVNPSNLMLTLQIQTNVIQNSYQPQWPIIEILSPRVGIQSWSTVESPYCSSFDNLGINGPSSFLGTPYSASYLAANFSQFQFVDPVLHAYFGYAKVGPAVLVNSVVTDGHIITYSISINVTGINVQCPNRGIVLTDVDGGRIYSIPVSYSERGIKNAFTQTSQQFDIFIQTTGQISIATTAPYHQRAFPIEVVYIPSDCGANKARQRITWQLSILDQFNPNDIVGPRNISDFIIPSGSNCYGDSVIAFQALGCSTSTVSCNYQFVTQTRCRSLTSDGAAFAKCSYSDINDRITDLGSSSLQYPTSLDGVHTVNLNIYVCPANSSSLSCVLSNPTPQNTASIVTANIQTNDFLSTSVTSNPFQALGGFLPTPTSAANTYIPLQDLFSSGVTSNTTFFDGNLFSSQPINVLILLPASNNLDLDLRLEIKPGNITIYPLDRLARRLITSTHLSLDWASLAPNVLYTTKNAYDDGCGLAGSCQTMPACANIRGCDGFSIPSSILTTLMPANGYEFQLHYRVGLPNPDGSPGSARKLLQLNTVDDNTFVGQASFTIQVFQNSTDGTTIVQLVDVQFDNFDKGQVVDSFLKGPLALCGTAIVTYFIVSYISKMCNTEYHRLSTK